MLKRSSLISKGNDCHLSADIFRLHHQFSCKDTTRKLCDCFLFSEQDVTGCVTSHCQQLRGIFEALQGLLHAFYANFDQILFSDASGQQGDRPCFPCFQWIIRGNKFALIVCYNAFAWALTSPTLSCLVRQIVAAVRHQRSLCNLVRAHHTAQKTRSQKLK